LLERDGDELLATFDPADVSPPDEFVPDESILQERSTFERVLDAVVQEGGQKQEAVAAINRLQGDLGVTLEAAAVVYARRQGVDVAEFAEHARSEI
jgi:hypothetical protein